MSKTIVSIGNGPSLRPEYFKIIKNLNIDSIGMNAAYRFYKEMNWWPTYYCCFDYALTETHKNEWSKMILDPNIPIKKYFFIDVKLRGALKSNNSSIIFPDEVRNHPKFVGKATNQSFIGYPKYGVEKKISSTGANSVRVAVELGYDHVILIGHDCSYKQVDKFKEAKQIEGWKYEFKDTPRDNPNYFWKNYQQKGDIFHKPGDQLPAWKNLKECLNEFAPNVLIHNCSKGTRIKYWKVVDFKQVIKKIQEGEY